MTEPKFTPGPWHIEIDVCGNGTTLLGVFDADDNMICDISDLEPITKAEAQANAALIAAAPEMYEELEDIYHNGFHGQFERIESVLRKARGESEVEK